MAADCAFHDRVRIRLEPSRQSALCSSCGAARRQHHDHVGERRWRAQDAFGVRTVLTARLRRVNCRQCGIRVEAVPWARPGSRYAKALEREIVEMARNASLLAVSRHFRLGWKAVYGIVKRLVSLLSVATTPGTRRMANAIDLSLFRGHDGE